MGVLNTLCSTCPLYLYLAKWQNGKSAPNALAVTKSRAKTDKELSLQVLVAIHNVCTFDDPDPRRHLCEILQPLRDHF